VVALSLEFYWGGELEMPPSQSGKGKIGFFVAPQNVPVKTTLEAKSPSQPATNATPLAHSRGVPAQPAPQRHRMRLADALRKQGIDEQTLAATYADVVEKLLCESMHGRVEKLLVDVLKECSRLLEKDSAPPNSDSKSGSTMIVVHNVPRPQRGPAPGGDHNGPVQ
jgi:hypothetical protein